MRRELHIARLGQRGEGIAQGADGLIYVPYALPGDVILAEVAGERGKLIEILAPSPDRIAAICPYYGNCGGCAVQALGAEPYAEWKRGLLVAALRHAKVEADVAALLDAHGKGRRRVTFHARFEDGKVRVGFMRARAHEIVDLESCPILEPRMQGALSAARAIAAALGAAQRPLDLLVTATLSGLDVDIKGHGPLKPAEIDALIGVAEAQDLARLSNDRICVIERRAPLLLMGKAEVKPPPGAFLQATQEAEESLAAKVCENLAGARRIADLFAGIGTFGLRLAETAQVHAVDSDAPALAALDKAARSAAGLRQVSCERRDLLRRPLGRQDLATFDALVFDPPRAGAEAQARILAGSALPLIVAISCNAQSFARDAALLVGGGYRIEAVTPFDQFRYSPHLEIVGVFRRDIVKAGKRRPLLG